MPLRKAKLELQFGVIWHRIGGRCNMPRFLHIDTEALLGDGFPSGGLDSLSRLFDPGTFVNPSSDPAGDIAIQVGQGTSPTKGFPPLPPPTPGSTTTSVTSGEFGWNGITFSSIEGYYYPPDNGFAANSSSGGTGLATAIAAENGAIQETSFTSASSFIQTTVPWTSFFTVQPGYSLTDPRVIFDPSTGHFVVTVDEVNPSAASSYLLYAVSNTSTPSLSQSNWTFHSVSTTHGATWSDQPLVAENNGILYVTTNQFTSNGHYQSDFLTIISSSSGKSAGSVSSVQLDSPSYQQRYLPRDQRDGVLRLPCGR